MRTDIDDQIDEIEMSEMTGDEAIKQIDPNGLSARIVRRESRYKLYKIRYAIDKDKKIPKAYSKKFRKSYEEQVGFDGWHNFAITWDVALHDPATVVSRMFSEAEEWERTVKAKFPQILPGGKIVYPDLSVQEKVESIGK